MDKPRIKETIVVEGKYDKNTLSQVVDALILETSGFGVFKDSEKLSLLRRMAEKHGLIILTDSDGAGFVIRNYLKGAIDPGLVKHAYIPDRQGKERRKRTPGKEGKLGVEGMRPEVLLDVLRRAGATFLDGDNAFSAGTSLTKADLFALGLTGRPDSGAARAALLKRLDLPEHLTPSALLDVLSVLYTKEELEDILQELSLRECSGAGG